MMFYFFVLALAATVQSVMYGPGAPLSSDPRLTGVNANPFADFMRLPIQMKQCRATTHFNADAIFDQSFVCPKNIKRPQNWPITSTDRFFIPDPELQGYAQQPLYRAFANPQNNPDAMAYYKQTYDALETWKYSGLEQEFSQCFSDLYRYEDAVQITKYKLDPVCKTTLVNLTDEAIWHTYNGRDYKCFIPFPQQLTAVKCTHPRYSNMDKCRLGYGVRNEYRCAPTNFVRRKVNLVCPEIQMVFVRSFDVPTACSCKLCYECDNVIPDPRAYLGFPNVGKK
ncbi:uncharacterized protein LOC133180834 [Saccostrea echinata]|uniref:uncharacterized protein LOC133180834 n=1 Tax=Saccostrea echinata TaxID=191078 RepID=UPI002A7F350E|nr:uncharacterized protein LOC133180834 [Saccostrea echinata]